MVDCFIQVGRLIWLKKNVRIWCVLLLFLIINQINNQSVLFNGINKISIGCSNMFFKFFKLSVWINCLFCNWFWFFNEDAYGTRDVIYDWKLDEHDGVEFARLKLSQFDLFYHKISKKEIQLIDRMYWSPKSLPFNYLFFFLKKR